MITASWAGVRRARGSGWGDSNSGPLPEVAPGGSCAGGLTCGSFTPWCPLRSSACRLPVYPPCTGGLRSRLVADASGAPVLRDHGPIGRPGHGEVSNPSLHRISAGEEDKQGGNQGIW